MLHPIVPKLSKRGEVASPTACYAMREMSDPNVVTEPWPARSICVDLNAMRSSEMRSKRGIGVSSAGALLRACRLLIAFMLVAAPVALLPVSPAAAQGDARLG